MKVLTLLGSPRSRSSSAAIAKRLCETATSLGAQVQTIELNKLAYRGCQGCYACKGKSERCVLQDDLTAVLASVEEADVLVLATPVYFGDVTAQLKGFLDRCYSFLAPTYMSGGPTGRFSKKKLVFIQVQGHPDSTLFGEAYPRIQHFLEWMGFEEARHIRVCGVDPSRGDAVPESVFAEAEETARILMQA